MQQNKNKENKKLSFSLLKLGSGVLLNSSIMLMKGPHMYQRARVCVC